MNHMVKRILIEPTDDRRGRFQATAALSVDCAELPGVCGGATDGGPWVRGYGNTIPQAVQNVLEALGEIVCHMRAGGG